MSASVADALASEGTPVTLNHPANGPTVVNLRYTFASLRAIEKDFGDLSALMGAVTTAAEKMQASFAVVQGNATPEQHEIAANAGSTASLFDVIVRALAPALLDERWEDRDGEPVWLGEDLDTCARAMDFRHVVDYIAAFSAAFGESFKDVHGGGTKDGATPPPTVATSRSRGPRGGTSSSAKPASRKPSSGA